MGPLEKEIPACRAFFHLTNISLIVFLSESPVREPPPCSLTGILHHQSHCPSKVILFFHSFIHVCLLESPKRSPPTYIQEKHKVTVHGVPSRQKAYIQWGAAWFPKGIINDTAISTPVPSSLQHDTFHLGLGRPEPC